MGNQQAKNVPRQSLRRRYANRNAEQQPSIQPARNKLHSNVNQTLEVPSSAEPRRQYHSIDYTSEVPYSDEKSIKSEKRRSKQQVQRDLILQKLSQKNQQLRRQLKKISDQLTEKLKHKKFVPKKKTATQDDDERQDQKSSNTAGLRRELQNGYKQIEMYKRTLDALQSKEQNDASEDRMKRVEHNISFIDKQINQYIQKIDGWKKVKKNQDKNIEKDINEDLIGGVATLKKDAEEFKKNFKELQARQRLRDVNYKKQQAYLFQVQRKWRQMNGDYFPQLKKKKYEPMPVIAGKAPKTKDKDEVSPKDYLEVLQELNLLKMKHGDYNKKIDALILQKNKILDESTALEQNIRYSDRIIQALKKKLVEVTKIFKPTKKSLFGYDNYQGTELQSEYNGGVDEIQKEIQEQGNQDQFDIRHLIANIPKPARQKVVIEFQQKSGKQIKKQPSIAKQVSEQGGMIVSGEKSQPKKWGSSMTRVQQKGRQIRKQAVFDDSNQFPPQIKPLIIGINLWVNKNNGITGLQAIYLNGDEIRYGSKSSNGADGFLQRYDLQSPDYLKNITGAFSTEGYLEYLVLYSKQGKIGTFGFKSEGQEQFTFGLSSTQRPFRIFGSSFIFDQQPRLNRFGIQICQEG